MDCGNAQTSGLFYKRMSKNRHEVSKRPTKKCPLFCPWCIVCGGKLVSCAVYELENQDQSPSPGSDFSPIKATRLGQICWTAFSELGLSLLLQLMCSPSSLPNVCFKETKWVHLLGLLMLPLHCITILDIPFARMFGRQEPVQLWTFCPTLHISPMQEHYSILTWVLDRN